MNRSLVSFGPDRRIRKRAEFVRAQSLGQRATTAHFVLLVSARETPGPARLGIVVTKKVGNAVARARVKRLCRECFRLWPDLLPDGIDLVVIAKTGAPALDLHAVRAEWRSVQGLLNKRCRQAFARVTELTSAAKGSG